MRNLMLLSALLAPSLAAADDEPWLSSDVPDLCPDRYLSETFPTPAPCAVTGIGAGLLHEVAHYRIQRIESLTIPLPDESIECMDGPVQLISTDVECIPGPLAADPTWSLFQILTLL